jgi:hypothetical protein
MMTMSNFFHRINVNCTIDSICTGCFRTIAVGNTHEELADPENAHHCERLVERQLHDAASHPAELSAR